MIPPRPWQSVPTAPLDPDDRFYVLDAGGEAVIPVGLPQDLAEWLVGLANSAGSAP